MDVFKAIKSSFLRKKKINKITLGICAMDKKARSKPMREILQRLPEDLFEIVVFGDDCILNQPIESWPVVDALISFYSTKFPTAKAISYVKLRNKTFMFNDLEMESSLLDRRRVYELLQSQSIDVPHHVYLERNDPCVLNVVEEYDEYIVVNGVQINKPLVEKPVNAEDHNIYIYYPMSAGGGSKRLFRKVDDRSSEFYPHHNEVRTEGSYIYEEFVHTQGTDVKVYTVGPDYGHAEARKSPVVDGKVNRDSLGYEVRYPVILTPIEKELARKVVSTFRQTVCGFDILRVDGKSYVCDVNGFSFVKNSRKYYDDASQILIEIMLTMLRPEYHSRLSTRAPLVRETVRSSHRNSVKNKFLLNGDSPSDSSIPEEKERANSPSICSSNDNNSTIDSSTHSASGTGKRSSDLVAEQEELRCVIAVIRHGDRTPKQKMKIKVSEQPYLDYFHSYAKSPKKDLKVKSRSGLTKFLEITREIIRQGIVSGGNVSLFKKLKQIRDVLERWEISGINRKLQMKPQKWGDKESSQDEGDGLQKATEVLLILKWGGDLTPLGRVQAENVGTTFRHVMYPDTEGGGVLRLHSTYRHDLKIKASDEGRVMKTAAAFAKGLLELEGQLTPILASLVTIEEKNRQMLDRGGNNEIKEDMDRCKELLNMLQVDENLTEESIQIIAPECPIAVKKAMLNLGNPLQTLRTIHQLIGGLCSQLQCLYNLFEDDAHGSDGGYSMQEGTPRSDGSTFTTNMEAFKDFAAVSNTYGNIAKSDLIETIENRIPLPIGSGVSTLSLAMGDLEIGNPAQLETDNEPSTPRVEQSLATKSDSPASNNAPAPPPSSPNVKLSKGMSLSQSYIHQKELKSAADGLYLNETFALMLDRWEKLNKDFFNSLTDMYDLTKVPDVYDMVRYDCLHNHHLKLAGMEDLYKLVNEFENSVVPQEYGRDKNDKCRIGSKMCGALLEKIKHDLMVSHSDTKSDLPFMLDHSHAADLAINSLGRHVWTRLYFTSESHIHTLLNVLRFPIDGDACALSAEGLAKLDEISQLSYLTQVVFRMFEDREDTSKFRCEISLSSGASGDPLTDKRSEIDPYVVLNKSIGYDDMIKCLDCAIKAGKDDVVPDISLSGENITQGADPSATSSMKSEGDGRSNWGGFMMPPSPMKRVQSTVTVVADSRIEGSSDRWELGQSGFGLYGSGKQKDKSKDKKKDK